MYAGTELMQRAPSCKPGHHVTEGRKSALGSRPDVKEMLAGGLQLPLLGPVPTCSLSPAPPSEDNLDLLGWTTELSDTVLHTMALTINLVWSPRESALNQAVTEEIMWGPLTALISGQEEAPVANRKPWPHCATRGRRLELWAGLLPRSGDDKRFYTERGSPT